MVFGRSGLLRGVVLGGRSLIRGVVFGRSGLGWEEPYKRVGLW